MCLLCCLAGAAKETGPGSCWSKLQKFILRAVDKQKKAPAAKKDVVAAAAADASSSTAAATSTSSKQGKFAASSQQPGPGVRQCWGCGRKPGADESLQKCSGCKKALYCSKECHVSDWKAHKADCKKWQQERAAGDGGK